MVHRSVSKILRRAVLMQMSVTSPALVACGGVAIAPPPTADAGDVGVTPPAGPGANPDDAGASGDGGAAGEAGNIDGSGAAPCSALSLPPSGGGTGTCEEIFDYVYDRTAEDCFGQDPPCASVCPPLSSDVLIGCSVGVGCPGPTPCTTMQLECFYSIANCNATGRRPRGLRMPEERGAPSPTARYLARMAHLEAASVFAFGRLARELEVHGAPRHLQRSALRAARDEVRHARIVTDLARRAGAAVAEPRIRAPRERSLVAMAVENAVEGCVGETFGAAVALAQSMAAAGPRLRAALRRIARDELRHAELAWRVAAWLEGRLTAREVARVARARTRAARALIRDASCRVHPTLIADLGLPPPQVARGIALNLAGSLWDAA